MALMPNSCPSTNRLNAQMEGRATSTPATTMRDASRKTSAMAVDRFAPSAMRMPISRLRCVTTNDMTPYNPTIESISANAPKPPDSVASIRSVTSDSSIRVSRLVRFTTGSIGSTSATAARIEGKTDSGVPRMFT